MCILPFQNDPPPTALPGDIAGPSNRRGSPKRAAFGPLQRMPAQIENDFVRWLGIGRAADYTAIRSLTMFARHFFHPK